MAIKRNAWLLTRTYRKKTRALRLRIRKEVTTIITQRLQEAARDLEEGGEEVPTASGMRVCIHRARDGKPPKEVQCTRRHILASKWRDMTKAFKDAKLDHRGTTSCLRERGNAAGRNDGRKEPPTRKAKAQKETWEENLKKQRGKKKRPPLHCLGRGWGVSGRKGNKKKPPRAAGGAFNPLPTSLLSANVIGHKTGTSVENNPETGGEAIGPSVGDGPKRRDFTPQQRKEKKTHDPKTIARKIHQRRQRREAGKKNQGVDLNKKRTQQAKKKVMLSSRRAINKRKNITTSSNTYDQVSQRKRSNKKRRRGTLGDSGRRYQHRHNVGTGRANIG